MQQQGFTIIEMTMALLILAVLGTAAGYGLIGGMRAFSENSNTLQTLDKLRYASERMAREVREIRRAPDNPDAFDIITMTPTSLSFTRADATTVTLIANPPMVTLAYGTPPGNWTLTDDVSMMNFVYLGQDGSSVATDRTSIAFVEFNLQLSKSGRSYDQRTRVALRNLQ